MGRMKKRKAESGKRERRGDPCGRPGARRTDCHSQCAHWLRNDGLLQGVRYGGSSGRPTPTHRLPIGFRRGRRPRRPASVTRGAVGRRPRRPASVTRGAVGRRDTWVPPYTALFCRGGRPCPPGSACSLWCVGEGLSCPPSCRPTDGHCRTRQSGHFLETGSLHPPLAALRRFPLPRATARVAPTDGNKKCAGYRAGQNPAPYV